MNEYDRKLELRITNSKITEIWKPIKRWEALYSVSNFGRIRSHHCSFSMAYNCREYKIMATVRAKRGRRKILLQDGKFHQTCYIHRLVAEAFLGVPRNDTTISIITKNGIGDDNFVDNLEIITEGKRPWCSHKIIYTDDEVRIGFDSIKEAAAKLNMSDDTIRYRLKSAHGRFIRGYKFEYNTEELTPTESK